MAERVPKRRRKPEVGNKSGADLSNTSHTDSVLARAGDPTEFDDELTGQAACAECCSSRWIGWQFQRDQFRLCAIFDDNHLYGNEPRKQRARSEEAKKLADANIWFNFDEVQRLLGTRASVPTGARPDENGFNKYNPNFVYQYRQVRDLTQRELIGLGRKLRESDFRASH